MRRALGQVLVAAALAAVVVVCLRLGWWQLQRYNSAGGSLQNLGYTLQWPTFAVFAVVMWWRLRKLERERAASAELGEGALHPIEPGEGPLHSTTAGRAEASGGEKATPGGPTPSTPPRAADRPGKEPTEPGEPDDELAAYNRYLAELNATATRRKKS